MDEIAFTPRELDVMSVLWRHGSATVAEARQEIGEELAYTSVLSALQTLEGEDPPLLEDYLRPEGVAFVEWPAAGEGRIGRPALAVRLAHAGEERRRVEVDW